MIILKIDLIGTVILPAGIGFAIYLVVSVILNKAVNWLPSFLLAVTLLLPGIVIIISTKRWRYFGWMVIYIIALPIWNFILPLCKYSNLSFIIQDAFWHFDDFSWFVNLHSMI